MLLDFFHNTAKDKVIFSKTKSSTFLMN